MSEKNGPCQWTATQSNERASTHTDIHTYPLVSMDIHEYPLISMTIHWFAGIPWLGQWSKLYTCHKHFPNSAWTWKLYGGQNPPTNLSPLTTCQVSGQLIKHALGPTWIDFGSLGLLGRTWIHFGPAEEEGKSSETTPSHEGKRKGAPCHFTDIPPELPCRGYSSRTKRNHFPVGLTHTTSATYTHAQAPR
jgi:hypothetical protein